VDAPEQTAGYCVDCGEYGRGRFAHIISEYADAIRQHQGCPAPRPGKGVGSGRSGPWAERQQ